MHKALKLLLFVLLMTFATKSKSQTCEFYLTCLEPYIEPDFRIARVVVLNDLGLDSRWFNIKSLNKSRMAILFDTIEVKDIYNRMMSVEEKDLRLKCDKIKFTNLKKAQKFIYRKKKKLIPNPVFSKTRYYFITNYIEYKDYYIAIFNYSERRDSYETNMLILKRGNEGYKIVLRVGLSAA